MSRKPGAKPHGQIRRSQIITTFGPGSMVDLPNHSVLIAGLDHWSKGGEEIVEPRLVEKLQRLLELPALKLYSPPPDEDNPTAPPTGITAWQFPEWFITQDVEAIEGRPSVRSRMLVHRKALTRGRFVDRDKRKRNVVPVRFVRACRAGHIADIDWYSFVHSKNPACRRQLWIDDLGTSGDLAQIIIRCECGEERPLSEAAGYRTSALGLCGGGRPWLGAYAGERCSEPSRLLIRTASNAYFPQLISVISLPDRDETVKQAVDKVWEFLEGVENLELLQYERRKARVNAALEGLSDEEVFAEIQSRLDLAESSPKTVKQAELETLVASKLELGEDKPDGTFFARTLPRQEWDVPWMQAVERVVLVHRLREVVAQVGFTRFEAAAPDLQGELEMGVSRADLAREPTWLPAVENRGEGFFLQFKSQAIAEWLERDAVIQRGRRLLAGFERWQEEHPRSKRQFFGLPYVLLHSLSHLLITAVSLECGYPASAIRERIYAVDGIGYGILLYTGTSDAEGTLGGLVQVGRKIHEHVRSALRMAELCSNDPVCAQHEPENPHERRFLHGAACHGCLLIAETSCEQHNELLDRALVVATVDNLSAEFFRLDDQ
jgi:hypothetical protein